MGRQACGRVCAGVVGCALLCVGVHRCVRVRERNVFTSFYRYISIINELMSNNAVITLGTSKFDGGGKVCSI